MCIQLTFCLICLISHVQLFRLHPFSDCNQEADSKRFVFKLIFPFGAVDYCLAIDISSLLDISPMIYVAAELC